MGVGQPVAAEEVLSVGVFSGALWASSVVWAGAIEVEGKELAA